MRDLPSDRNTLAWVVGFIVIGWLFRHWLVASFLVQAIGLAVAGALGMLGSRRLLVAPLGLLIGDVLALITVQPRINALEFAVNVATLSIAVLAGMATRAMVPETNPPR